MSANTWHARFAVSMGDMPGRAWLACGIATGPLSIARRGSPARCVAECLLLADVAGRMPCAFGSRVYTQLRVVNTVAAPDMPARPSPTAQMKGRCYELQLGNPVRHRDERKPSEKELHVFKRLHRQRVASWGQHERPHPINAFEQVLSRSSSASRLTVRLVARAVKSVGRSGAAARSPPSWSRAPYPTRRDEGGGLMWHAPVRV